MSGHARARRVGPIIVGALLAAACGSSDQRIDAQFGQGPVVISSSPSTTATAASTSTTSTTTSTTTSSTTTIASTTTQPTATEPSTTADPLPATTPTTTPTTTTVPDPDVVELPATGIPVREAADPSFAATNAAFELLATANVAASLSVARAGELTLSRASGITVDGAPATADSPMVIASVSKLVVGVAIARLAEQGDLQIDEAVPWGEIGVLPDAAWFDVSIRELLDHAAGVPKVQASWFKGGIDCPTHVQSLVLQPPMQHRGTWVYSNGNYCLLGMVVSARTGLALDVALQRLVFDPVGVEGVHLTDNGLLPGDLPHPNGAGVARLSRLGGAGNLIVSTDDLAIVIGRLTPEDRAILMPPAVFSDQYGFGHTGTIEGAKSCVWALDDGDTVIAATIAGNSPNTGGAICDIVVPAIATDLGIGGAPPDRWP